MLKRKVFTKMFEEIGLETVCLLGRLNTHGFSRLIKEKGIDIMVVTKDSGEVGGVLEKIHVARKEGIDAIVIERHRIAFPQKYSSIDDVVNTVKIQ